MPNDEIKQSFIVKNKASIPNRILLIYFIALAAFEVAMVLHVTEIVLGYIFSNKYTKCTTHLKAAGYTLASVLIPVLATRPFNIGYLIYHQFKHRWHLTIRHFVYEIITQR